MSETSSQSKRTRTVVASAPGKILLAGGYLVLESCNVGLVIAVDKRFYTTVRLSMNDMAGESLAVRIIVSSPQLGKLWVYEYKRTTHTVRPVIDPDSDCASNPFVEKSLQVALLYLDISPEIHEIHVTIRADQEFYGRDTTRRSEGEPTLESIESSSTPLTSDPRHGSHENGSLTKTGLGSSACLVTSLIAALCYSLEYDASAKSTSPSTQQQSAISSLSQIAHCLAQGKIGSGFDVSAACVGSHAYRRFPEGAIQNILKRLTDDHDSRRINGGDKELQQCLRDIVQGTWMSSCMVESITFFSDSILQVMLADVAGGSESPGMARNVLRWKNSTQDSHVLWTELSRVNDKISRLFMELLACQPSDDERARICSSTADEWNAMGHGGFSYCSMLYELHRAFLDSRRLLKTMGNQAGVPIEPDEQTRLADATMTIPGVVAALCPGAGGFDALACVYVHDKGSSVRTRIKSFWAQWTSSAVGALDVRGISFGEGVRIESLLVEQL